MRTLIAALLVTVYSVAGAQILVNEPGPKVLTPLLERLGAVINTNGPIRVTVKPCGVENAWWDNRNEITYCREILQSINKKQREAWQTGRINANAIAKTGTGEAIFVLFHELSHALIDRHGIPFTGREEDAADQFAAWLIMKMDDPSLYVGALNFFAEPSRMLRVYGNRRLTDEHGLNVQRRAQMICWGYGRDPQGMRVFANHVGLSESRLQRCPEEFKNLMRNTPLLFGPALNFR